MKAAAITALLAASLATAEVIWTFQKFENGVEVPFTAGPQTKFQSQAMAKVGETRKRNHLNGRTTVASSNWCGAALTGSGFTSIVGTWIVPPISLRPGQTVAEGPGILQWIMGGTLSELTGSGQVNIAWTGMAPAGINSVPLFGTPPK
ncbi:hypothetical protein C8R45DRAFT_1185500 [Mycena sanguinolenta]|nr:hypothetical protein C8R45DRAFT_1185500 [Mycena sanguinolenta]